MSEAISSYEPKLEQLENELGALTLPQEAVQKLLQIKELLATLQLSQIYSMKDLMVKHLKPLSKDVTNFNLRGMPESKPALQSIILVIIELYAKAIRYRFQVLAFELLSELLDRSSGLFKQKDQVLTNDQYNSDKNEQSQTIFDWVVIKTSGMAKYTLFYYKCHELVFKIFDGIQGSFKIAGLSFIKELINYYKMSNQIKSNKLSSISRRFVEALEAMVGPTGPKEQPKELSADMIKTVSQAGSKLSTLCSQHQIKRRFQMLSSIYGLGMLSSSSIERKLNGLKLINKESQSFYRSSGHSFIREQEFVNWLFNNRIIDLIFEESAQTPILKHCNYILRIVFKRRCLGVKNFQKILEYVDQASPENRQLVLRSLELESIRLEYADYEVLVAMLKIPHRPDFYEQDLFSICNQCIRYSTNNILKEFMSAIGQILKNNFNKFRNEKIEHRCLKCYVKTITRLFDKEGEIEFKKKELLNLYDTYFQKQFTPIGVLVFKNLFEELPEISQFSKTKTACYLIKHKNIIQSGLAAIKSSQNQKLTQQIEQLLCSLLKFGNDFIGAQKIAFTSDIFVQAVHSPRMFQKLTTFVSYNNQQLMATFQKLLNMFSVSGISFQCIKTIFFRINFIYVREIKEYNQEYRFQVLGKVSSLKGVENLKYLLLNSSNSQNRSMIADFIADLYTSIPESRIPEGELQLENFLKQTLQMTLNEYKSKQSEARLLGYLALVQSLMMNTQILGVGKYRPHNSLVPISTVQINILNDISYGNDVSQSYWKKVSSNLTLFDLLQELSQKFRCSACEISLQQGQKFWPEKWNGLTLEQLKIDDVILKAVKTSKEKIRKEKLIQMGELTVKAKKVFQEIYKMFAVDGKMGYKQCANFVAGVTKTSSSIHDGRVIQFFRQYDTDQDDNLDLQDFYKFYKNHCTPDRDDIVWKNLNNMRFRKDLKKYDDPIEITNENILFRSLLYQSEEFYELLFSNSDSQQKQLQQRCKRLLLRLPTFPKTLQSLKSDLDLISKNCFQTEYLLIAIRSKLNQTEQNKEAEQNKREFIESGNFLKIFQMMIRIDNMPNPTQDEKKCLFISLQIMRSLLQVPDLRTNISVDSNIKINLNLPETYLFLKLSENALKNIDIDILEASLALQMTQKESQIKFPLEGIFHDEIGIRKICSNYLFVLYALQKIDIDLFEIEQKPNCEFWFQILTKVCSLNRNINFQTIIKKSLSIIKTREQSIQKNPDDPIIFGNLSIICSILQHKDRKYEDFSVEIMEISEKIISVRSRKLIYNILAYFDVFFAVEVVTGLIDAIQHVREVQPKKCYVGLKNLGSTCYMNSVLQVLFCVPEFKDLILSLPKSEIEKTTVNGKEICDNSLYQLQKMYTYLLHSKKKYFNPQQFCLTIKKGNTQDPIDPKVQEDAHEFVGKFLDKLEKEVEKTDKIDLFRQLFEGTTVTQVLCKKCSNKINREEKFSQLSLAVQEISSLEESFQKYIVPEEIEDYFCSSCNCKVEKIEKSTHLNKLPKLLTINLQRIVYDLQNFVFKKIDTNFSFPQTLNVYNYLIDQSNLTPQDCQFHLKAITVHSGTSQSGHYYSIIRIDKAWYKFNDQTVNRIQFKDIPHECFGGSQSKQQWTDDLKFSTNAYMLFYESKNDKHIDIEYNQDRKLVELIQEENRKFYRQLQVHQESVFIFAIQLYDKFVPKDLEEKMKYYSYQQNWQEDPNIHYYQAIYEFHMKILKFSTVFYDVKSDYVFRIGQNLFRLFYLLPQKTYSFVTSLDPDSYIQNLCLHNDDNIRSIHKYLLNKSMHVFLNYYQTNFQSDEEAVTKLITIIDCLFVFLEDERLMKNIAKSFHYFDFWRTSCEFIGEVIGYLVEKEALVIFGEFLVGASSPFKQAKDKKKAIEIPYICAMPIIQTMVYLMSRKKNMKNYIHPNKMYPNVQYYQLTEKEKILLGDVSFYAKMMNSKYDNGQLGLIAARFCQSDYEFSKKMVPIFLKGLNNIINPDSAIVILAYIRHYLAIEDELIDSRLKWILGIPQLRMGDELVYGLSYEDQSLAYQYISPLYFIKHDKQDYKTALTILYENHSTYNSFSVEGVTLLLNLMCVSEKIFEYIMKLPAPTYLHRSYLDWIQKFITNFKDSYVMQQKIAEKAIKISAMLNMYNYLTEKTKTMALDLPVNKFIIGRNRDLYAIESEYTEEYKMTLWAHLTYILPNLPTNQANNSLPKDLFKFGNPTGFAKYFISIGKLEMFDQNIQINSQLSTYTLEIQAKQSMVLKFNLPSFNEHITIQKGKIFINFPYKYEQQHLISGKLSNLLDVMILSKQEQMLNIQKMQKEDIDTTDRQLLDYYSKQSQSLGNEKACQECTFLNKPGERVCQVCLLPLD